MYSERELTKLNPLFDRAMDLPTIIEQNNSIARTLLYHCNTLGVSLVDFIAFKQQNTAKTPQNTEVSADDTENTETHPICPCCQLTFVKRRYNQVFCKQSCKDKFHNDKKANEKGN